MSRMKELLNAGIACESGRLASASYGRFETRYQVSRFYDDGFGPVWIYQDAGGLLAIIRASSWEDAYGIVEDVILDDADPDDVPSEPNENGEYPDLPDGMGFRPNGGDPSLPWAKTGIYQEDLNGSRLELLTAQHMSEYGIRLLWVSWDEDSAS